MQDNCDIYEIKLLNLYTAAIGKESIFYRQVVGSQARILYSDRRGRVAIATAFNKAVSNGTLAVSSYSLLKSAFQFT